MIILFLFIIFVALLNKLTVNVIIGFTLYFFSEIAHYLFLGILGIFIIFLAWCFSDD
jgi:hypothetical protein